MQHKPRSLLSDAQRAAKLVAADAVLTVRDGPHADEPFIEAERGILEDRADFKAELFPAVFAAEHGAGCDLADADGAAVVATRLTVRPPPYIIARKHNAVSHKILVVMHLSSGDERGDLRNSQRQP